MKRIIAAVLTLILVCGAFPHALSAVTFNDLQSRFSHGEVFTHDAVAEVLEALLLLYNEERDFDFQAVIQAAGLTEADIVEMLVLMIEMTSETEWYISTEGDSWLLVMVADFISDFEAAARDDGMETAALELTVLNIYINSIRVLGYDEAANLFSSISMFEILTRQNVDYSAFMYNPHFIETLERMVSEYGTGIFNFNLIDEFWDVTSDSLPPGMAYLDELLNGYISDTNASFQWDDDVPSYQRIRNALDDFAENFAFGEEITIDDVIFVYQALVAFHMDMHGLYVPDYLEAAGFSEDEFIHIIFDSIHMAGYKAFLLERYGEQWAYFGVDSFVWSIAYAAYFESDEKAAAMVRYIWLESEINGILNDEEYKFSLNIYFLGELVEEDLVFNMAVNHVRFMENFERIVSEHGVDIFIFDFHEALSEFPDNESIICLLELFDGVANIGYGDMAEWVDANPGWYDAHLLSNEWTRVQFLIMRWERMNMARSHIETRFSFDFFQSFMYTVYLFNNDMRLNIYYENNADSTVTFYCFTASSTGYNEYISVEIPPRDRFTMQINFAELPSLQSNRDEWFIHVAVINEDGEPLDGEFAFRFTEYPLGHVY